MLRHDLKNPLAGVVGLARLLSQHSRLDADQARKIHLIEEAAMQALDTVNMSSEVFKIETGRYELDPLPCRWSTSCSRRSTWCAPDSRRSGLPSIWTSAGAGRVPGPDGRGDPALCRSVLHNLIKNACEAAPTGGWVTVSLLDESPLQIVIRNRGAVPAAVRPVFFERYATGDRRGARDWALIPPSC